jgi:hypothetical protein
MPEWFLQICGWIPGIIFPVASALQLLDVMRAERVDGISPTTWALFALSNVSMYIYVQKYDEWQTLGFLLNAALQIFIVVVVIRRRRQLRG